MGRSAIAARPISASEREVLERAIRLAPTYGAEIPSIEHIDSLQVVGKCSCGCASVDFRHLKPGEVADVVADAVAETPNGEQVGVLVFAFSGEVVALEIVGYSDQPALLPVASTVRDWSEPNAA